jgi:hypothetical protein
MDTVDHQSAFAAISAKTPVDQAFRTAFLRNKLLIAHTHPGLDVTARDQAVAALVDRLGREAARDVIAQPRPGGVGEGVFYTPDFKTNWGLGTSISCDFVCPVPPGGNVNTWLYLTATNRSGLGSRHSSPIMVRTRRISGCTTGPGPTPGRLTPPSRH